MTENWTFPLDRIITGDVGIRIMRHSSMNSLSSNEIVILSSMAVEKHRHKITAPLSSNTERSVIKSTLTKQGDTSRAMPQGYPEAQILFKILISSSA